MTDSKLISINVGDCQWVVLFLLWMLLILYNQKVRWISGGVGRGRVYNQQGGPVSLFRRPHLRAITPPSPLQTGQIDSFIKIMSIGPCPRP